MLEFSSTVLRASSPCHLLLLLLSFCTIWPSCWQLFQVRPDLPQVSPWDLCSLRFLVRMPLLSNRQHQRTVENCFLLCDALYLTEWGFACVCILVPESTVSIDSRYLCHLVLGLHLWYTSCKINGAQCEGFCSLVCIVPMMVLDR